MVSKTKVLTKIFGDPQNRILKGLQKKVVQVNALSEKYQKMSDEMIFDMAKQCSYAILS